MSAGENDKTSPMVDRTDGSNAFADGERGEDRPAGKGTVPTDEQRRERKATIAYSRAEGRGFGSGLELEDWLEAERQVDDEMAAQASRVTSDESDSPGSTRAR
jgi:hypothetical protein